MITKLLFMSNEIHVGAIIKAYLQEHRIYKSALARKIGKRDEDIARYQKAKSLKTDVLILLCEGLEHNFFADIAQLLPSSYTQKENPEVANLLQQIKTLQQEIEILKAREDALLQAFGRK